MTIKRPNQRVREALSAEKAEEKVMKTGVLFMVDGKICMQTIDDELMCRIDHTLHDTLVEMPGVRTMEMKGKPFRGYIMVPIDQLKTKKQLDYFTGLALQFNKQVKPAAKKGK